MSRIAVSLRYAVLGAVVFGIAANTIASSVDWQSGCRLNWNRCSDWVWTAVQASALAGAAVGAFAGESIKDLPRFLGDRLWEWFRGR